MNLRRRRLLGVVPALATAGVLAGCADQSDGEETTDAETAEPESSGEPLSIGRVDFAAEQPQGYRDYEPVEDATYELGEVVWVYFEPEEIGRESAGSGSERIELTIEGTFTDAEGEVQETSSETVEQELVEGQSTEGLYLWVGGSIPADATAGTWRVEITLTDEVTGESTTVSREFEVEGGQQADFLSGFRSALQSDTEIRIRELEMRNSEVRLAYASSFETNSRDWLGEIGAVAGIFVRLVDHGWEAERLAVTTTGNRDRTVTWHLDREVALEFAAGEMTNEEFVRRILETVEEA